MERVSDLKSVSFKKPGALKRQASLAKGEETQGPQRENEALLVSSVQTGESESRLPIHAVREQILYLLETHQVLILLGQTGSGKTTQVPQFLYDGGWSGTDGTASRIVCTQPRRMAAVSVATRVAQERACRLGTLVGYAVRFDACYDAQATKILYTTDGLLFREIMGDPLLSQYAVVIVDESHERSLYSDLLLGLLKKILAKRKELRLVVCSATLDAHRFLAFFSGATEGTDYQNEFSLAPIGVGPALHPTAMISCEGRSFPVSIYYANETPLRALATALDLVLEIHANHGPGDILVFLSGRDEIEELLEWLTDRIRKHSAWSETLFPLPLYSGLAMEQQRAALLPIHFTMPTAKEGARKVILATNVAEASVTIDGIVYVVDLGRAKYKTFDPALEVEVLASSWISQASAVQRAGRAGRNRPGTVFRLYTEATFATMSPFTVPELQRCDWMPIVLQLKALGIDQLIHFQFPSRPPVLHIRQAMDTLNALGALDDTTAGRLTVPTGELMAILPIDPRLTKSLVAAATQFECAREMIDVVAMLSISDEPVFVDEEAKVKFAVEEGDALTLYNAIKSFSAQQGSPKFCQKAGLVLATMQKAVQVKNQIIQAMRRFGLSVSVSQTEPESLKKSIALSLAAGHCHHLARWEPNEMAYRSFLKPELVLSIHPSSVLFRRSPLWIVYDRVLQTKKSFVKNAWVVEPEWMALAAPNLYDFGGRYPHEPLDLLAVPKPILEK